MATSNCCSILIIEQQLTGVETAVSELQHRLVNLPAGSGLGWCK